MSTYFAVKVVSSYLRTLCKNRYFINDIQKFTSMLSSILPLKNDEKDVSYDIKSFFTNILIKETIKYVIEQIYVYKKLKANYLKLIFRRLLIKITTECTFKFSSRFFKQVDGCTMRGSLLVTFGDIYMIKMENDVVIPSKAIFYPRVEDDVLFDQLNK